MMQIRSAKNSTKINKTVTKLTFPWNITMFYGKGRVVGGTSKRSGKE